jgi:ribosomal protein L7/L12
MNNSPLFIEAAEALRSYHKIFGGSEQIRKLIQKLDAASLEAPPALSDVMQFYSDNSESLSEVDLLRNTSRIAAVKQIRTETGCNLNHAVAYIQQREQAVLNEKVVDAT